MKVGDLVMLKEETYGRGFHAHLYLEAMIVTEIETTMEGFFHTEETIEIEPVVTVAGSSGINKFCINDLEVVNENH